MFALSSGWSTFKLNRHPHPLIPPLSPAQKKKEALKKLTFFGQGNGSTCFFSLLYSYNNLQKEWLSGCIFNTYCS